jgi:hypothetical protein
MISPGIHVGGEARPAAGHRPDQVERPQAADQRQDDHRDGGRPGQRQHDPAEVVPGAGAVDAGGLEVLLRDRHDAGDVDDGRQAHALPDVDQRHRQQRVPRVGQPARAVDADRAQRLVDQAALRVHEDGEGQADPDGADQGREEHHRAQVAAGDDLRGEQQRQQQAEHDLEAGGHHRGR